MGGQTLNLKIRITGDGSNLKAEVVGAESSLKRLASQTEKSGARADKAHARTRKGVDQLGKSVTATGRKVKGLSSSLAADSVAAKRASASMRNFAGSLAVVQGPLGPVAGRVTALSAILGRVGIAGLFAAGGVTAFSVILGKGLSAAASYESQMGRLKALIRGTGGAAKLTAQEIDTFSIQLGEGTLTSARAVRDAAGALLSFRSISGSQFKETLTLSQDLAATMRTDLRGAAVQLAKALEQPEIGLTMLRRAGVSFTEQQRAQIIALAKSGKQFEAQQLILDSVRKTVGGAGAGEAQGLTGAIDTLGERWTRMLEGIGGTPAIMGTAVSSINVLSGGILSLVDHIKAITAGALLAVKLAVIGVTVRMTAAALATNTLSISMVGLRAASLGLFMLYKSGGVKALLSAPFISMAAATKTAFAGVSKLTIASGVLFAAYAGWQIGSYLSDQFAIVRQAGVALVAGMVKGWTYTKSAFELMGAGISIAWDNMISGLKHALGGFLALTSRAIDALPFMDGVAATVKGYATQLQNAQGPLETFAAAQKRINDERDRTIGQQDKILAAMFVDASKEPKGAASSKSSKSNGASSLGVPTLPAADPTKKLFSSADALTRKLSDTYKSSFERISDRYSTMFDKLEALGKPGMKKLEALSTAYATFTENSWLKQEEKRKSILSRGVEVIAESLLSEDERRKQALDNRVAMLQQAQDDGLISEQRGLELRNQLHADYDQQLADQKTQAALDAEQNANDLKAQFAQVASGNQLVHLGALLKNLDKFGKSYKKIDKSTWSGKVQVAQLGMKMVSGLMESHNRKAFELGKTAAIADATVSTVVAVMKAWKDYGWPVGAALGVGVAAAGAINVAKIASTKMGGAASAGGIAGGSASAPSVTGGASNVVPLNPNTGIPQQPPAQHITVIIDGVTSIDHIVNDLVPSALRDQITNNDLIIIDPRSRQAALTQQVA